MLIIQGQKSESSRPSVSPNRGEHGSSDGQGSADLGFKPSLLEEILTEKKLVTIISILLRFFESLYNCIIKNNFLISHSKTYVVGTQKNRLNETFYLSTQNTC